MLVMIVAKMMDPILFSTALVVGALAGRWWVALLVGLATATLCQMSLRDADGTAFAAATIAFTTPAFIGFMLRKSVGRRPVGAVFVTLAVVALSACSCASFLALAPHPDSVAAIVAAGQATPNSIADPMEVLYASGRVVRPQPTPEQELARQLRLQAEAPHSMFDDVVLALRAGNNITANLRGDFDRTALVGNDAGFDHEKWIEENAEQIPQFQQWRFMLTRNALDSALLLQQLLVQERSRNLLAARGI